MQHEIPLQPPLFLAFLLALTPIMGYNVRKGQSQVMEKASGRLACADAFSIIWRAKRPRKNEVFTRLCPWKQSQEVKRDSALKSRAK